MKKLKELYQVGGRKLAVASAAVSAAVLSASAQAAYTMPTAVTTFFTDAGDAWDQVEALVWPVLGAVLIGMFVMRKVKQGANKA